MKSKALFIIFICISPQLFAAKLKMETFSKTFIGNIGKYKVTLYLTNRFSSLGGYYIYNKYSNSDGIDLNGTKINDHISLFNYNDEKGKPEEKFDGVLINDSTIIGSWSNGKKRLPFKFTEIKTKKLDLPVNPNFDQLRDFYVAEPWESHFFEKPIVETHMRKMLKDEYYTYLKFLEEAGCYPSFLQQGEIFYQDFSYLHIGCIDQSIFVIDEATKGFYLCWIKDKDGASYLYSDKPDNYIPKTVMQFFTDHLNEGWGHVYTFKMQGSKIIAVAKSPQF